MSESTVSRLRAHLETDIVEGRYRPGDRLDEVSLGERFGLSRTPVREALRDLAASGLLELRPRRGAFVRRIGAKQLVEMFETMAELEAVCARFAAARLTLEHEAALNAALDECRRAAAPVDTDAYCAANDRFHAAIYAAAGNAFLEAQAVALKTRLMPFRRHQIRIRGRVAASLDEHVEIVAAIVAGDGVRAGDMLRPHVSIQGEKFRALIASIEAAERQAP